MNKFFFDQPELPLLSDKDFAYTPIVIKYQTLFKNLDLSHIKDHNNDVGCSGYSTHSMISEGSAYGMKSIYSENIGANTLYP